MTLAKSVGWAALVLLATTLWLVLVSTVATLNSSDAAGNGLSYASAIFITIALWVVLGVVLLVAASRGAMPAWVGVTALVLHPLSCAASFAAVDLLRNRVDSPSTWPIVVPVLVPLLVLVYSVWAYVPSLRAAIPAGGAVVSAIVWGAILLLALSPWPLVRARARTGAVRRAGVEEAFRIEEAKEAERKHQENLAKFATLTSDSSLFEWLKFTTDGNELRDQALAGIRQLQRRQADAEEMIGLGLDLPMLELPNLDLQVTPAFCGIAGDFLRKDAERFRPNDGDSPAPYSVVAFRMERHLPAMRWLVAHNCGCDAAIAAYEASARLYPNSPERAQFLVRLAELRRRPG